MKKKNKKILTWIIIIVFLLAVGFGIYKYIDNKNTTSTNDKTIMTKRTAVVKLGDVSQTLAASGPIESSDTKNYKASFQGEIDTINIDNDDFVKKGDVLITFSTTSLDDQIENLNNQIENSYDLIDSANDDIINLQDSISDIYEDIAQKQEDIADLQLDIQEQIDSKLSTTIYAPISGITFNIRVEEGDMINDGTILATISNVNIYKVELSMNAKILEGNIQSASIYYKNTEYSAIIISHSDYTYKDKFGSPLVDVILQFETTVSLPSGDKVSGIIVVDNIKYYSNRDSLPYYAINEKVTSTIQGELLSLNIVEKEFVNKGDILATISCEYIDNKIEALNNQIDLLNDQIESFNDQIDSLNNQIEKKGDLITDYTENISDIQESIETLESEYTDLKITADFDGVISHLNIEVDDNISPNSTLFTLTSMDKPQIIISIDELDIAKVKLGMDSSVVIDALEDTLKTPISAKVTDIALLGINQGGVTSYNVTITLEENIEGLMLSMNSTATIFIDISYDTLYVPIEAITILNGTKYVYIKTDGTDIPEINSDMQPSFGGRKGNVDTSTMTEEQLARIKERREAAGLGDADIENMNSTANSLQEYYTGTKLVEVTTGVFNESYIEITSGLEKGQIVVLPPTYTTTSTNDTSGTGLFGSPTKRVPGMGSGGK